MFDEEFPEGIAATNDNARSVPWWEYLIVGAAWAITIGFAYYIVLTVKEAIFS